MIWCQHTAIRWSTTSLASICWTCISLAPLRHIKKPKADRQWPISLPSINLIGIFHPSVWNGICSDWLSRRQQNEPRMCVCVVLCAEHSLASVSLHRMPGTPTICLLWLWLACCFSPGSRSADKDRRRIKITARPRHTPHNPRRANTAIASFQPWFSDSDTT